MEQESGTRAQSGTRAEVLSVIKCPKVEQDSILVPPLVPPKTIGISSFGTSGTSGTKKIRNTKNRLLERYRSIYLLCFRSYIESLFLLFHLFHLQLFGLTFRQEMHRTENREDSKPWQCVAVNK